jgi:hypothetical protein
MGCLLVFVESLSTNANKGFESKPRFVSLGIEVNMRMAVAFVTGFVVCGFLGYWLGAYVVCYWLYPGSNLCGLVGVFVTGPIGAIAGGVGGLTLSYRGRD